MTPLILLLRKLPSDFVSKRCLKRRKPPPGKPPCLPPAKTKRYRIVNVPWQDPSDVEDLLWRRHAYLDAVASIRLHLRNEYVAENLKGAGGREEVDAKINSEFENILKLNEEENKLQAVKRDEYFEQRRLQIEDETKLQVEAHFEASAHQLQQRRAEVLATIEESNTYVTRENLVEKVLHCLENPVDYNFAIDLSGNVYKGHRRQNYLKEFAVETKFSAESAPCIRTDRLTPKRHSQENAMKGIETDNLATRAN